MYPPLQVRGCAAAEVAMASRTINAPVRRVFMHNDTHAAVSGVNIKGEMSASEDITFEGTFEGSIDLPQHRFVAGKNARVNASVSAKTVSVDGHIDGHIAADVVDIRPTAVVSGSIVSPKLSVIDGASVNVERQHRARPRRWERREAPGHAAEVICNLLVIG